MFINFNNIQVSVSGLPIMVESAELNYKSNIEKVFSVGHTNCVGYTINGTPENNLSLNYIIEIDNDPNLLSIKNYLKNDNLYHFEPVNIIIGNISGQYYPTNYQINFDYEDGIIKGDVEYVNFYQTSGVLQTGTSLFYNINNNEDIAHVWTSNLFLDGFTAAEFKILNFDYSCQFNWEPAYQIGSRNPYEVNLLNGKEKLNILLESYQNINFSGQSFAQYFGSNIIY